jgi:hypothetical protein
MIYKRNKIEDCMDCNAYKIFLGSVNLNVRLLARPRVDGRIILKLILKVVWEGWSGLFYFRIGSSGRLF